MIGYLDWPHLGKPPGGLKAHVLAQELTAAQKELVQHLESRVYSVCRLGASYQTSSGGRITELPDLLSSAALASYGSVDAPVAAPLSLVADRMSIPAVGASIAFESVGVPLEYMTLFTTPNTFDLPLI